MSNESSLGSSVGEVEVGIRLVRLGPAVGLTRHLAPNPTARATHAWNQACNTKWLVRLLGPRVGRRDAEDKTNKTRTTVHL